MPTTARRPALVHSAGLRRIGLAATAAGLLWSLAPPLAAAGSAGVWQVKIALAAPGEPAARPPSARCGVRLVEGSSELNVLCRHQLGGDGEVSLVGAGSARDRRPLLRLGPLADPFETVVSLPDDLLASLLAGGVALRIESREAGIVVEGSVGTPIFDSGFDVFSLCEWSNYPCPSDANARTDEVCSPTGVCSHPFNTDPCVRPNATAACSGGSCQIVTCDSGYSHCDESQANGCEVDHDQNPGPCENDINYVGSYAGDTFCGFLCPFNSNYHVFATRTGRQEAWYSADVLENSSCSATILHQIDLEVPAGVDYDLYVYKNCQLVGSSFGGGTGEPEVVVVSAADVFEDLDDFGYQVEVRWFFGKSCSDWTLTFTGRTC